MEYKLDYGICAILFSMVIIVRFFSKRQFPNMQNKIFGLLLLIAFIDVLFDVLSSLAIENALLWQPWLVILICSIFYSIQMLLALMLMFYTLILLNKNLWSALPKWMPTVLCIPAFVVEVLIILNVFIQNVFYVGDSGFIHTDQFVGMYIAALFYILVNAVIVIAKRRSMSRTEYKTLLTVILMVVLAVVIQYFNPEYLLTGVAIELSLMIVYFLIQKPEEMLDPRTKLFNSSAMNQFVSDCIETGKSYHVIQITITNLDTLNRLSGQTIVDDVLNDVAKYLRQLSKSYWIFRLPSKRFVLLFNGRKNNREIVSLLYERFKLPWELTGANIKIRLNTNIHYLPETSFVRSAEELFVLLEAIDEQDGSMLTIDVDERMLKRINRRLEVEAAIVNAMETGSMELYYQPIYEVKRKRFTAAEALLRFKDEHLGMVSPSEFIPIAEKAGLIFKIDEFVINEACRFIASDDFKNANGIEFISVNLSAAEFLDEELPSRLIGLINKFHIDSSKLMIEITETATSTDQALILSSMRELTDMGLRFSLDDFGTGYSNIAQVVKLPLYAVKMDRSLISIGVDNTELAVIFHKIAEMFRRLGITVVAEGAENRNHIDFLIEKSMDYIQGFYYSEALPQNELLKFLEQNNV